MAINFPDNPVVNDVFVAGLNKYIYDGENWVKYLFVQSDLELTKSQITDLNTISDADGVIATIDNFTTSILTTDTWQAGAGYYYLPKILTGILSTDNPVVDLDLSIATLSNIPDIQTAWGTIYRVETADGIVTFYSIGDDAPVFPENTNIILKVVR